MPLKTPPDDCSADGVRGFRRDYTPEVLQGTRNRDVRRKQNAFYRVFNNNIYYSNTPTAPESEKRKTFAYPKYALPRIYHPAVLHRAYETFTCSILYTGRVVVEFTRDVDSSVGSVARSKMS